MAGGGAPADGSYLAVMGDEDTITGFLLAGVGNVDLRKKSNFLIVNESERSQPLCATPDIHTIQPLPTLLYN